MSEPAKDGRDEVQIAWEDWRAQCVRVSKLTAALAVVHGHQLPQLHRALEKRRADFAELIRACIRRRF